MKKGVPDEAPPTAEPAPEQPLFYCATMTELLAAVRECRVAASGVAGGASQESSAGTTAAAGTVMEKGKNTNEVPPTVEPAPNQPLWDPATMADLLADVPTTRECLGAASSVTGGASQESSAGMAAAAGTMMEKGVTDEVPPAAKPAPDQPLFCSGTVVDLLEGVRECQVAASGVAGGASHESRAGTMMGKGGTDEVPPMAEPTPNQPLWYTATVAKPLADVQATRECLGAALGVAGDVSKESSIGMAVAGAQMSEGDAGHTSQVNVEDDDHSYLIGGGPLKKRAKSTQSSIVPLEDDSTAISMSFTPRSRSDSNQLEGLSIEYPSHIEQPLKAKGKKKARPTKKKQGLSTKDVNVTTPTAGLEGRREAEDKDKEAQFENQRPKRASKPNKRYSGLEWKTLLLNTGGQVSNDVNNTASTARLKGGREVEDVEKEAQFVEQRTKREPKPNKRYTAPEWKTLLPNTGGQVSNNVNVTTSIARLKGRRKVEDMEKEAQFEEQRTKRAPKPNKRYTGPEWKTLLPNTGGQASNDVIFTASTAQLKGRRKVEDTKKEAQFEEQRTKRAPKPNKRYTGREWKTLLPNTGGQVSNII